MRFPLLNPGATSRDYTQEFRGYNHNLRIADGEAYDEENMSSDNYPVLTQRKKRNEYLYSGTGTHQTVAAISKDELYYVDNLTLYKKGELADTALWDFSTYVDTTAHPSTESRHLVSMGAYIIILPDLLYYNTSDLTGEDKGAFGYANEAETSGSLEITIYLCDEDGNNYIDTIGNDGHFFVSDEEPQNPSVNDLWLDLDAASGDYNYTSSPISLKRCTKEATQNTPPTPAEWALIEHVYLKISCAGISSGVKAGDWANLALLTKALYEDYKPYDDKKNKYNQIFNKAHKIVNAYENTEAPEQDYIVIEGLIKVYSTESASAYAGGTFIREGGNNTYKLAVSNIPILDFVIESGNRLWGCRYGANRTGAFVNEIYASQLGNFRNWFALEGLTDDSYMASRGSDGAFTGAVSYLGYPLFFKENILHKVYGNMPSNYQVQDIACPARGVLKGAAGSLAIVGERLYYKSRTGVCVYDGSLPMEISAQLGALSYNATEGDDELWNGAVAGADNTKYYISMKSDTDGEWNLFVYDVITGVWHRENNMRVYAFCRDKNTMYYIADGLNEQKTLGYYDGEDNALDWYVVTGDLGLGSPDKKYVSRVTLRMALEIGAFAEIAIQYDNSGAYEHISTVYGSNLQTFSVPVRPKRCDHFRLKITGKGICKLYSISKTVEQGSDR